MLSETDLAPKTEAELAALIGDCAGAAQPLAVAGGGTRVEMDAVWAPQRLRTGGLSGIMEYDPGTLTLIARAGTPLAEIETALAAENQALAFEPMDMRGLLGHAGTPTIGGVVAANAAGPRRLLAGACRDHLLGLRFVDGRGRVIKNGGRVMKNVTGLDLGKLFCGSFGTLGVLSEVALKTLPLAPARATLAFDVGITEAVAIFTEALATPFEVSGAAWQRGTAWLRIEGLEPQVAYRSDRLKALLGSRRVEQIGDEASVTLWRDLRDLNGFASGGQPVWKILTRPSKAAGTAAALRDLGGEIALDWGGSLIWYAGDAQAAAIRTCLQGGHATRIRRGNGPTAGMFTPETGTLGAVSARLRRIFDPNGILNPGLGTH